MGPGARCGTHERVDAAAHVLLGLGGAWEVLDRRPLRRVVHRTRLAAERRVDAEPGRGRTKQKARRWQAREVGAAGGLRTPVAVYGSWAVGRSAFVLYRPASSSSSSAVALHRGACILTGACFGIAARNVAFFFCRNFMIRRELNCRYIDLIMSCY